MTHTPEFTFSRRIGNTTFTVRAFCDPNEKKTFEDRFLNVIRADAAHINDPPTNETGQAPPASQERSA